MIEFSDRVRPSLALELVPHAGQANQAPMTPSTLFAFVQAGPAWVVRADGVPVAVGGYYPMWEGRAVAWAYLCEGCRPALPAMTRRVRRQLDAARIEYPRIEAYADRNHKAASRWLDMLGFRREGLMRNFNAGADFFLYAKV